MCHSGVCHFHHRTLLSVSLKIPRAALTAVGMPEWKLGDQLGDASQSQILQFSTTLYVDTIIPTL